MTEVVWAGAEALRGSLAALDQLRVSPGNPRRGDLPEIVKSLRRWGQVRAVLADTDGTIIAGNHTYLAAREAGWTHIAVVTNDFASPEEARAYLLADNRLGDQGEYDRTELVLFLQDLEASGAWDGTGYQPDDLAHLRGLQQIADAPLVDPEAPPPVEAPQIRELVLHFPADRHAAFSENVRRLRAHYGFEGVTETVFAAVRDEALRLNQAEAE